MNLKYIQGFIEFYSIDQYQTIEQVINSLGERNFFNLVIDQKFNNNHGSIIIPYARSFRSDENDKEFLNEKINELIWLFVDIGSFCIDVVLDLPENKFIRFSVLIDESYCSISYSDSVILETKSKNVRFEKERINIEFIE